MIWKLYVVAAGVLALAMGVSASALAQRTAALAAVSGGATFSGSAASEPYRLPPEKLELARALGRIRPALHFGSEAWEIALLVLLLASGGAARLGGWVERRTRHAWLQAALFALVLVGGLFLIADLPLAAVGHAYSRLYGISVESWGGGWAMRRRCWG